MKLPQIAEEPVAFRGPQSSVSQRDYNNLGATFDKTANEVSGALDAVAAPMAEKAGADYGRNAVTQDANGNTVVQPAPFLPGNTGAVFERSAMITHAALLEQQAGDYAVNLHQQTMLPVEQGGGGGDPNYFKDHWATYSTKLAAGQPGMFQEEANKIGLQIGDQHYKNLLGNDFKRQGEEYKDALTAKLANLQNSNEVLAANNHDGPEFAAGVQKENAVFDALAADPRTGVSQAQANQAKLQSASKYQVLSILGTVQRAYDPNKEGSYDKAMGIAATILNDPSINMSEHERLTNYHLAVGEIRQMESGRKAEISAMAPQAAQLAQAIKAGVLVDRDTLDQFYSDASKIGGVDLIRRVHDAEYQRGQMALNGRLSNADLANVGRTGFQPASPASGAPLAPSRWVTKEERDHYNELEQQYGLPTGYLGHTAKIESEGDGDHASVAGSNVGRFQFNQGDINTWLGSGHDVNNHEDQVQAAAIEAAHYKTAIQNVTGQEPGPGLLYLAHQQRDNLLKALQNPDGSATATFGHSAVTGNAGSVGMTNSQFVNMWVNRFETGRAPAADVAGGGADVADAAARPVGARTIPSVVRSQAVVTRMASNENTRSMIDAGQAPITADPIAAEAYKSEVKARVGLLIPQATKALDAFSQPNPEDMDALQKLVGIAGDEKQQQEVAVIAAKVSLGRDAMTKSPAAFEAEVNQIKAGIKDKGNAAVAEAVDWAQNKLGPELTKRFAQDPWSTAVSAGYNVPSAQAPIDFANPQSVAAILTARSRDAGVIQANRPMPPFSLTTPGETEQAKQIISNGTADQKAAVLAAISTQPEDYARATLAALGQKGEIDPELMAGSIMQQAPSVAKSILSGMDVLKDGKTFEEGKKAFSTSFASALPPAQFAMDGQGNTLSRGWNAIQTATLARLADQSFQRGEVNPTWSDTQVKKALDDVTGGVVEWGSGQKLFTPKYGMGQGAFKQVMNGLTPEDLHGAVGPTGQPLQPSDLTSYSSRLRLQSVGDGKYLVYQEAAPLSQVQFGAQQYRLYVQQSGARAAREGGAYVLDLKGVADRVLSGR